MESFMRKILLAASVAAVASLGAAAPGQACWHNCYRPETDGPWYTHRPYTNPGYFSGLIVRIYEPRYAYRYPRHARRHAHDLLVK
jgi:hypothetical protein